MSDHMSLTDANRELLKNFYALLGAGNFVALRALLHEDVEVHEPACLPYGGIYRGFAGFQKLFAEIPKYLDTSFFSVETIIADGDHVVSLLNCALRGVRTHLLIAEESLVRNGKIARFRVFQFDPTLITQVAGRQATSGSM